MLNDNELVELIENIDDSFAGLMTRHNINVSELTGAIVARLLLVNQVMNSEREFLDLLQSVIDNPPQTT